MHIAAADGAPGFEQLAHAIALEFGASDVAPLPVTMGDDNYDWDVLYPFSAVCRYFLQSLQRFCIIDSVIRSS